MTATPADKFRFRVAKLPQNAVTPFELRPDTAALTALAAELGIDGLRKLVFKGTLAANGATDWQLDGHLGATVIQPCVATLEPVTTRLEEDVTRHFVKDYDDPDEPEVEMPDDDTTEALGAWIDVEAVMTEALILALPLYPRADDTTPSAQQFAAPGTKPMTDDDAKPFAGLADLRAALGKATDK